MLTLKTEKKLSLIALCGSHREVREVACHYCGNKIRFLLALPRMCPKCMSISKLTSTLYTTIDDRLRFYLGAGK